MDGNNPEQWLEEYGDYLYRQALFRVRRPEIAEELVQETFLAALKSQSSFEGRSSVKTWLVTILKNKATDYLRKAVREEPADLQTEEIPETDRNFNLLGLWRKTVKRWNDDPEELLAQKQFGATLEGCLSKLSNALRQVLLLKSADQLSGEEICKACDISPSNLWVMVYRARMQMRECLESNWFRKKDK